jgi:hypothetical protein
MPINFEGDQDQFDQMPEEWKDHFMKAVVHKAGFGPNPGIYKGSNRPRVTEDPTEAELASAHMQEEGPPGPPPPQGPVPPPEQVQQPMPGGGGKKQGKQKPPSGTTPTAIGAQTVKPPEPEGEF